MKKYFAAIRDYLCYCGIDKNEYKKLKKDAYISNFIVWKYLHLILCAIFAVVAIFSFCTAGSDKYFVLCVGVSAYCVVIWLLFKKLLKPDCLGAQFIIYLTMIILLVFGIYSGIRQADMRAVTFEILLVVLPMVMIDKPYFMAILLSAASAVYIMHVYSYKTGRPMTSDISNTVLYCVIGILINVFYNSLRVRDFLATRTIKQQRDCDATTGLLNNIALENEISYELRKTEIPGAMLVADIDGFKNINFKYGHGVGDQVLTDIGACISEILPGDCIKGRSSGDVFTIFIQGKDALKRAETYAAHLIKYTNGRIHTPDYEDIIGLSIGIAESACDEFDYDTLYRKAEAALAEAKANGRNRYAVYSENSEEYRTKDSSNGVSDIEISEDLSILNSLNSDYDLVCVIDAATMACRVIHVEDWLKDVMQNRVVDVIVSPKAREEVLRNVVYPADFDDFAAASMHSEVVKNLMRRGEYTVNYRGYKNGELVYYQSRYLIDKNDPGHIVFGTRCIDSHVRAETERTEMSFLNDVAEYMPGGFFVYKADDEELIAFNSFMMKLFGCENKREFAEYTHNSFKGIVHPDDYGSTVENIGKQTGISVEKMNHVIYRIVCKDGSIKWIDAYGHLVYSHNYGNIFYVFVNDYTQTYNMAQVERQAEALLGEQIKIKRLSGENYGELRQGGVFNGTEILFAGNNDPAGKISKELLEKEGAIVTEAPDGETALKLLLKSNPFDVILLDIEMPDIDGVKVIERIRETEDRLNRRTPVIALIPEGADDQLVQCLKSGANDCISKPLVVSDLSRALIKCMKEHSIEIEKKLADTIKIANTDALTHVKNVSAYTDKIGELTSSIAENKDISFGIVLCDINDLKHENDTYGHESGNYYIQNSCNIICEVFRRSPVYRIGGDEFAVILQGHDYHKASDLMKQLSESSEKASKIEDAKQGKASVAAGLAFYDPDKDVSVSDVIKRADAEMYKAKRAFKEAVKK